jgi:hypothetical protein
MKKQVRLLFSIVIIISLAFALNSCGNDDGGITQQIENTSVTPSVQVLDESSTQYLSSVSEDGSTLTFSGTSQDLESLSPGDFIVSGVTETTPNGFLCQVTGVSERSSSSGRSSEVVIETAPATLEDIIEKGTVGISKTLTPDDVRNAIALRANVTFQRERQARSDEGFYLELNDVVLYDDDGDDGTTNDQIRAEGSISFYPSFDFTLSIDDFQITQLNVLVTATETVNLDVTAEIDIIDIHEKIDLYTFYCGPFVTFIGVVPIVVTPILTASVGVDGEVSIGVTTGITQEAALSAGLTFDNGSWNPVSDFSNDFQFDPPSLFSNCNVKGYAGVQLNLLLYGVVGPYGEVDGYLELWADLFSDPWWELYGGFEAGIGVKFEVLSYEIADYYYPGLIGYRAILAQAESPADTTSPTTPSGLSTTAASSSKINLSWEASSDDVGVTFYNIFRDGSYLKSIVSTSTSDTGLNPDTRYCYVVSASDEAGNESELSDEACERTNPSGAGEEPPGDGEGSSEDGEEIPGDEGEPTPSEPPDVEFLDDMKETRDFYVYVDKVVNYDDDLTICWVDLDRKSYDENIIELEIKLWSRNYIELDKGDLDESDSDISLEDDDDGTDLEIDPNSTSRKWEFDIQILDNGYANIYLDVKKESGVWLRDIARIRFDIDNR